MPGHADPCNPTFSEEIARLLVETASALSTENVGAVLSTGRLHDRAGTELTDAAAVAVDPSKKQETTVKPPTIAENKSGPEGDIQDGEEDI